MKYWNLYQKNLSFVSHDQVLAPQQCQRIIEQAEKLVSTSAHVGSKDDVDNTIRQGEISRLDPDQESWHWIYKLISDRILAINDRYWKFDIDRLESLQFTKYLRQGDHYADHTDFSDTGSTAYRKLSFSCQITDPSLYQGCDLEICLGATWKKANRNLGSITVFPSWQLHRVTSLEIGQRYSLVGWMSGPCFK